MLHCISTTCGLIWKIRLDLVSRKHHATFCCFILLLNVFKKIHFYSQCYHNTQVWTPDSISRPHIGKCLHQLWSNLENWTWSCVEEALYNFLLLQIVKTSFYSCSFEWRQRRHSWDFQSARPHNFIAQSHDINVLFQSVYEICLWKHSHNLCPIFHWTKDICNSIRIRCCSILHLLQHLSWSWSNAWGIILTDLLWIEPLHCNGCCDGGLDASFSDTSALRMQSLPFHSLATPFSQ